jgi:hypothetical protein
MKQLRWMLTFLAIAVLAGSAWGAAQAGPPTPLTPRTPPDPPLSPPEPVPGAGAVAGPSPDLGLPPLKAVLLVGPIDGDFGPRTTAEKENMDLVASELEANGVTVHKFYTPENDWTQISAAAEGAHFLFYRGHGVYWTPMPNPVVGGFRLRDKFVSSAEIRSDLHLAPNAIVMLYGCFTAGSSSVEIEAISSEEAQRRVVQYSDPFFDIGAAGYYANWYGDAFQILVRYLFQGMTLGQAYEAFYDFSSETVERYQNPDHPIMVLWLDKDFWWESWQYDYAFVGLPDHTLAELFHGTGMRVLPSAITHLTTPDSPPRSFTLRVDSTSGDTFNWTAEVVPAVSWLDVQPRRGTSGGTVSVVLAPAGRKGTYEASVRIVADAPGVQNGDQTVPVTLHVTEREHVALLPMVLRSAR